MKLSVIYSLFLISIFKESMQIPARVPEACRELSASIAKCFRTSPENQVFTGMRSHCKKLPRIARKCQRLSESWQLLAETCQKKTSKAKVKKTSKADVEKNNKNFNADYFTEEDNTSDYCKKEDSDKIKNLKPKGQCTIATLGKGEECRTKLSKKIINKCNGTTVIKVIHRLNSVKNTNFGLDNKKLFLMH